MENYIVESTKKNVPEINFDAEKGFLLIKGMSNLENTEAFYKPVLKWLGDYLEQNEREVLFVFQLFHFNTAASKCFLDILYLLEDFQENGGKVRVEWRYKPDDPDMMDLGLDFQEETSLKIHVEEIPV